MKIKKKYFVMIYSLIRIKIFDKKLINHGIYNNHYLIISLKAYISLDISILLYLFVKKSYDSGIGNIFFIFKLNYVNFNNINNILFNLILYR